MLHDSNSPHCEQPDESRRDFLKKAGIAGLSGSAVGIAGIVSSTPLAPVEESPEQCSAGSGDTPDSARHELGGTPIYDAAKDFPTCEEGVLPPLKERVLALKQLVLDQELLGQSSPGGPPAGQALIDAFVEYYEKYVGPRLGAAVVAHAWVDPAFRDALLNPEQPNYEPYASDPDLGPFAATKFIRDFLQNTPDLNWPPPGAGTAGLTIGPEGEWLRVMANGGSRGTPKRVHNLVSCTLCSCYPQALLGVQPIWYKSKQYRARSISAPRGILREFANEQGTSASDRVEAYLDTIDEVRVWDSNSEVRFLVIPEPPAGADLSPGNELALRGLVTRNSMIGTEIL